MAVTWKKLAFEDDVIVKSLLTNQGDVIYASAVGIPAALHPGTAGQVLITGGPGANPYWGAGGAAATSLFEVDISGGLMPVTGGSSVGLFELDGSDDLMPATGSDSDVYFELDGNNDLMSKTA